MTKKIEIKKQKFENYKFKLYKIPFRDKSNNTYRKLFI